MATKPPSPKKAPAQATADVGAADAAPRKSAPRKKAPAVVAVTPPPAAEAPPVTTADLFAEPAAVPPPPVSVTVESDPATAVAEAPTAAVLPSQAELEAMIAEAAYYLAEKRNFQPGFEAEDWATATATATVMARFQDQ